MNAFMLYMSGNSIQIFSIMITVMLFWNSLTALLGATAAFEQFQKTPGEGSTSGFSGLKRLLESNIYLPWLVYVVIQAANLGLGVWKCNGMGLLPTTYSDWLSFMEPIQFLERVHH
ncbi:hypothetical protein HDU91_006585 [Kappamyces sp. JEL0680]|nr:hypothetical protein HDU91_006585 [Kappamyces sp. JEL0680]